MAKNSETSKEALAILAGDHYDIETKCAVASNPNTPQEVIDSLIQQEKWERRDRLIIAASLNKSITQSTLELISRISDSNFVRLHIASKILNPEILTEYALQICEQINETSYGDKFPVGAIDLACLLASKSNISREAKMQLATCKFDVDWNSLKIRLFKSNLEDIDFLINLLNCYNDKMNLPHNKYNDKDPRGKSDMFFKCDIAESSYAPVEILKILAHDGGALQ
jgi:hypothetical protein